ncbi:MAG: hypothetical protein ACK5N0_06060 [Synechococcaceae cyanobacterium]
MGNPPFDGGRRMKESRGQDWLHSQYSESSANGDLCAFFYLCCFTFLGHDGSFGLIAINTIALADTRSRGLSWTCTNWGSVVVGAESANVGQAWRSHGEPRAYSQGPLCRRATTRSPPGGADHCLPVRQGRPWGFKPLKSNAGASFMGSNVLGKVISIEDWVEADDDTPGIPLAWLAD